MATKSSKKKPAKAGPPWPKRSREEYLLLIQTFLDSLLADAVRPLRPGEERVSPIKKH
jgi:hypothetical protein